MLLQSSDGRSFQAHRLFVEASMPNLQREEIPPNALSEEGGLLTITLKATPAV